MTLSIYPILLCLLISTVSSLPSQIPGCPDLQSIDSIEVSSTNLQDLLLCFCEKGQSDQVSISCLYGSTPQHLQRASLAVSNANLTINQLSIQHMEFTSSGLDSQFLSTFTPSLSRLDIRECAGGQPLVLHNEAFKGLESTLVNITIHDCKLSSIPRAIHSLHQLNTLILSSNDIQSINKNDLNGKNKLSYLDISGNQITQIEEGSFESLTNLQSLLIGDHNYINDTFLQEISRLSSLKLLDLSRADGIFNPPEELFSHLPMLNTLKMGGCSLSSLDVGVFSSLGMLQQLDLRVNLIENISSLAFDGLSSLKRLSLAGNYIRNIDTDYWAGLGSLEDLDIGWNELRSIDGDAFASIESSLQRLHLRHNPINQLPSLNLPQLTFLSITETNISSITFDALKNLPKLETLEALRSNISSISSNAFDSQSNSIKVIQLNSNKLRSFNLSLESLPSLQELSLSGNPFICDNHIEHLITNINEAYQRAAKEGRSFTITNTNETLCARPWKLKGKSILGLNTTQLEEYNESLDTTTTNTPSTTTIQSNQVTESITLPTFTLPDLFAGKDSNESIFKDDRERLQYDLTKTDTTHQKDQSDKSSAVIITIFILLIISAIALISVILFMRKKKRVSDEEWREKKKVEDGMVEIELEGVRRN